jgi:23S rRNA (guanine1835-N2)-methyltransferase
VSQPPDKATPAPPVETLSVPQGEFELQRRPHLPRLPLRAWDAADEYLLQHVAGLGLTAPATGLFNDAFGALAVALSTWSPVSFSDSFLSQQATRDNLARAQLAADSVSLLDPFQAPPGPLDLVLVKVPKTLALLEHELCTIRPFLGPDTVVVGAGMVKHMPAAAIELFERLVGPTTTSRAQKKARLVFATPDPATLDVKAPAPVIYGHEGRRFVNHANVFRRDSLDMGTRLLMEHLPSSGDPMDVIDLGCGNGIVGITAAAKCTQARLQFRDESHMAVASARANFEAAFGGARTATFEVQDALGGVERGSVDRVLLNPPFHQEHAVGDFIARQMFGEAAHALRVGGELWVVGNRHLDYHRRLKQRFGVCRLVASTTKFVVLAAVRGRH